MRGSESRGISFPLVDYLGNKIYKGEQIVPIIRDKETLFRVTDAAISFFEKHANAGERFRLTLERVGKEEFKKEVQAAYEGR